MAHEPSMTGKIAAATSAIALGLALAACGRREDAAGRQADTAFAAMQARGQMVMGVDQYASATCLRTLKMVGASSSTRIGPLTQLGSRRSDATCATSPPPLEPEISRDPSRCMLR